MNHQERDYLDSLTAERDEALYQQKVQRTFGEEQWELRKAAEKERDEWQHAAGAEAELFNLAQERTRAAEAEVARLQIALSLHPNTQAFLKQTELREAAEARVTVLEAAQTAERKAWAGVEGRLSDAKQMNDALSDAARRVKHGDHYYDPDGPQEDCTLCAAIDLHADAVSEVHRLRDALRQIAAPR